MDSHLPTPLPMTMHPAPPTPWPAVLTPMSAAAPSHAQVPTLRLTCHPRLPLTPWPPWLQLGFHYLPSQPSHSLPPLHYTSPPSWITTRRISTPLHLHSLTSILQFLKLERGPNRSIWQGSTSLALSHHTLPQWSAHQWLMVERSQSMSSTSIQAFPKPISLTTPSLQNLLRTDKLPMPVMLISPPCRRLRVSIYLLVHQYYAPPSQIMSNPQQTKVRQYRK